MFSIKNSIRLLLLKQKLKSPESSEREAAAEELGDLADPTVVQLLTLALKDESLAVRRAAARGLQRYGSADAVAPLIAALDDTSHGGAWQIAVLTALEQLNDSRAVPGCVRALSNSDPKVRRAAANALGTLGDSSAVRPLLKAVLDEAAEVSQEAGYALAKIGRPALKGLQQILREAPTQARIAAVEALGVIGERSTIPDLAAALKDKDCYLQIAAAKALARFNDAAVIEPLIAALDQSGSAAFAYGVRDEAAAALLRRGPRVIKPLLSSLSHCSPRGRLFILKLLGEMPEPSLFDPLVQVLKDDHAEVRKAALAFLLKLDRPRSLAFLPPLLDDADANLRRLAAEALSHTDWHAENAPDRARFEAALGHYQQALQEGETAVQLLLQRLQDHAATVRAEVAAALGRLKNPRFLPNFATAALQEGEGEVQQALVQALEWCGQAAIDPLISLLEEAGSDLRRRVGESLLRLGWRPQTDRQTNLFAQATGGEGVQAAVSAPALPSILPAPALSPCALQAAAA